MGQVCGVWCGRGKKKWVIHNSRLLAHELLSPAALAPVLCPSFPQRDGTRQCPSMQQTTGAEWEQILIESSPDTGIHGINGSLGTRI